MKTVAPKGSKTGGMTGGPVMRAGIEIHQQLEGKKLFCGCPTAIRNDPPSHTVHRRLRSAEGETGETDVAARHEERKGKTFTYQFYDDTTCLVELDEEPPHAVNPAALATALVAAHMLGCTVVDRIQFMRKTVVDGSNTSGFQRTALIARNGSLDVDGKKIGIQTVCLEEDSCMISERNDGEDTYNLSRLGIPLVEIATDPDMTDPAEVQAVAAKIGMVLRSFDGVKRGLGTIRQDVNVSVPGGSRIEIKGAQDLRMVPTIAEYEAKRQMHLLSLGEELRKRGLSAARCTPAIQELTSAIDVKTAPEFLAQAIMRGEKIYGAALAHCRGLISKEEIRNQRLGYEFATIARTSGFGGIMHSDEDMAKYGIGAEGMVTIKKYLSLRDDDGFVLCLGERSRVESLFDLIIRRLRSIADGRDVVGEVRKAEADGTSTFLRPMPGAARMYPETDIPLITPNLDSVRRVELIEEKAKRLAALGISPDQATAIAKDGMTDMFTGFVGRFRNVKPAFIAETMLSTPTAIRRKEGIDVSPSVEEFSHIFSELDAARISKDAVYPILCDLGRTKTLSFAAYGLLGDAAIEKEVARIIADNTGKPENVLVGIAMAALKGRADPSKVIAAVRRRMTDI